jgi:hypothetical protein
MRSRSPLRWRKGRLHLSSDSGRNKGDRNGVSVLLRSTRVIGVTPQADVPPKPVKVLFVEDEVLLRLMMTDVLGEEGFQWSTAAAWPLGARAQQGWPS